MAAFTTVNLKDEVDNQGPGFGIEPDHMQLRMGRVPLGCENCGVSYKSIGAGRREPFGHKHNRQEEVYVLVNGSARMKLDDDVVELRPWSAVRIPPETMRQLEAGPEGAEFVVVGAPSTGQGDGDIEPGWWSD